VNLNLGCGENHVSGFINVDKYGTPDVKHDLEVFPWPWEDNSIDEILMNHILEHLGETSDIFLSIMKEIYRICKPGASIKINCPHPRHDDFISDPTHVRAITPRLFELFSKKNNEKWAEGRFANSPLALYLDVDFEIEDARYALESPWREQFNTKEVSPAKLDEAVKRYNNVIKETQTILRVIK
jgi:SAM-dependent methyltransferase